MKLDKKKRKIAIIICTCLFYIGSPVALLILNQVEKSSVHISLMTGTYIKCGMFVVFVVWMFLVTLTTPSDNKHDEK